jgi:hypothetical protein
MTTFQLAQINVGRMRAPLDDAIMRGFVARLEEINALADASAGFVWRLQTPEGDATYLRPFDDERIIVNMSVWENVAALKAYAYHTAHAELLKQRRDWFEHFAGASLALWWVPAGYQPSVDEGKQRLAHLEAHGPSQFAFTFRALYEADAAFIDATDWSRFAPCPA